MGVTPPRSLTNPVYAAIAFAVSLIVFIPFVRKHIELDNMVFVLIDALGLGTFTVIGIEAAAGSENIFLQIFLGVMTGVGGGVLRDVFAAERPVIFVKRFYATASLLGAIVCAAIYPLNKHAAMIIGIVLIVILRFLAAKFKWNLPTAD